MKPYILLATVLTGFSNALGGLYNYQPHLATLLSGESPVERTPSTRWKAPLLWRLEEALTS